MLLQPKLIQNFIYNYVDSKMKSDKMTVLVGKAIEDFLHGLDKPLQLNEMRVMKESNYVTIYPLFLI